MCGVDSREGWERHSSLRIFIYVCGVCICININVCFVCIGCLVVWLLLTLARRRSHVVKLARRLTLSLARGRASARHPTNHHLLGHCQQIEEPVHHLHC